MTDTERNLYQLAENLHQPLYRIMDMPLQEYMGWLKFYSLRSQEDAGKKNLLKSGNPGDAILKGLGL